MTEAVLEHMHADLEQLKKDISVIKHILSEEGKLTPWARKALSKARTEPPSSYTTLNDL